MYGVISEGRDLPLEKVNVVVLEASPGLGSRSLPFKRPGPAAGPSVSIAIFELQNTAASFGNLSNALHLFGSLVLVLSNASNLFFASGAKSEALVKSTPSSWRLDAAGGL